MTEPLSKILCGLGAASACLAATAYAQAEEGAIGAGRTLLMITAGCVVDNMADANKLSDYLKIPDGAAKQKTAALALLPEKCSMSLFDPAFKGHHFRQEIYVALYNKHFAASTSQTVPELKKMKAYKQEFDESYGKIGNRQLAARVLGDCVVRHDANLAHRVVTLPISVKTDNQEIELAKRAVQKCMKASSRKIQLRFSTRTLKGFLAESLVKAKPLKKISMEAAE